MEIELGKLFLHPYILNDLNNVGQCSLHKAKTTTRINPSGYDYTRHKVQ